MRYQYNPETGYVALLDVELVGLPKEITIEGYRLLQKGEFHVSIMAIKRLAPMITGIDLAEATKQLTDVFFNFIKSHNMKAISLSNELILVKRDERVTLVVMVAMPFVEELFTHLRSLFDINFPTQPAHITIYTLKPEAGIGLLSQDELETEGVVVEVSELDGMRIEAHLS